MFKWLGGPRENLPGGSLKYLFGYFKVRIFKSSYRIYTIYCVYRYICLGIIRKFRLETTSSMGQWLHKWGSTKAVKQWVEKQSVWFENGNNNTI